MAEISNLAYVVFDVSDLPKWEEFAVDIVGMQVGRRDEGKLLSLRMDEYEQRVWLQQGNADDILVAGWELDTEGELEEFVHAAAKAGGRIRDGGHELAERRRVEKIYVCDDPTGYTHELFFGPTIIPISKPFRSKVLQGLGFETGPLGLGHILTAANDYKESVGFYQKVLGLRISDYIRAEIAPGQVVDATFLHSASGRHHSLATAQFPAGKRLNHFMVQYQSMDDVGMAFDRAQRAGVPLVLDLGHHPNDRMFSFYVKTPSGFAIEIGSGGIVVDDDTWKIVNYSELSDWGHKRHF
ncbi:3-methylcatechol 2,3-dioxygenase [Methylocella tundrae]|uniref:3-methylcatechol 2,3-dioxygenase n=1 Tax=Methylocella tundrae TaxID=227605 RepID=A0A8B6MA21_METTU|nr:VOC family protein [Methylocella tundrae]VTZ27587.1 3-methylcatechol 2,3-dioxygenase [Methylocella tundrae]VTZ51145.1 3-methylcatechol 2,3-dioxygenase [Methylocella tundrae]